MTYIFVMRIGSLMRLAIEDYNLEITLLKKEISSKLNVTENNLILIANGGYFICDGSLDNYDCGQEHNPVFVFVNQNFRLVNESAIVDEMEDISGLAKRVRIIKTSNVPRTLTLLLEMDELGIEFEEMSCRILPQLENCIRDQYLLVEGWSAAIANLSDSVGAFDRKLCNARDLIARFNQELQQHLLPTAQNTSDNTEPDTDNHTTFSLTQQYQSVKHALEKIPILPALVEQLQSSTNQSDDNSQEESTVLSNLLEWVEFRDRQTPPQVTLQTLVNDANSALVELTGDKGLLAKTGLFLDVGDKLVKTCSSAESESAMNQSSLEQIDVSIDSGYMASNKRSYTDNYEYRQRLHHLQKLKLKADESALALKTHREYMENVVRQCQNSPMRTVLSDHSEGALAQTEVAYTRLYGMLELYDKVRQSKIDLVENVRARTKWIEEFETQVCTIDETLFLTRERIKRVRTGWRVIDQMRSAPELYGRCLIELSRRRCYNNLWITWGAKISHNAIALRQQYLDAVVSIAKDLDRHFLQALFHQLCYPSELPQLGEGLLKWSEKLPPIPHITQQDLQSLADQLPIIDKLLQSSSANMSPEQLLLNTDFYQSDIEINNDLIKSPLQPTQQVHSCNTSLKAPHQILLFNNPELSSYDSLNLSLLPVPTDNNEPITKFEMTSDSSSSDAKINDDMDIAESNEAINNMNQQIGIDSQYDVDNQEDNSPASSRLFQSINSQEFQLADDSKSKQLTNQISQLKLMLNQLTQDIDQMKSALPTNVSQLNKEIDTIKRTFNQLQSQIHDQYNIQKLDKSCQSNTIIIKDINTQTPENSLDIQEKPNLINFIHKEIRAGDRVLFIGKYIAGKSSSSNPSQSNTIPSSSNSNSFTLHWQMLTSDSRIYFLHDECLPKSSLAQQQQQHHGNRRSRVDSDSTTLNTVAKSPSSKLSTTSTDTIMSQSQLMMSPSPLSSSRSHQSPQNHTYNPIDPMSPPFLSAIFISQEEYICKKKTNRYGLPENTRFFRVKATIDR